MSFQKRAFALLIALSAATVGCGPIVSGVQITKADIALAAAQTAGAPKTAVYEYAAATEYLKKAREENAYSDFHASKIFADKALDFAERAKKRAEVANATEQSSVTP